MTTSSAADFYAAFHLRQACCQALLDLSHRQAELIQTENFTEMFDVLQSKQALIEHLEQLNRKQQPLHADWKTHRESLAANDRARCEAVLAQMERLMADVMSSEESSTRQLQARRDVTQRELQALSHGAQAQLAYQSRPPTTASRLDLDT